MKIVNKHFEFHMFFHYCGKWTKYFYEIPIPMTIVLWKLASHGPEEEKEQNKIPIMS